MKSKITKWVFTIKDNGIYKERLIVRFFYTILKELITPMPILLKQKWIVLD